MKLFFFLGALAVVGLVVTGAIKLQKTNEDTYTIQVDRQRVREDVRRVVDEGREVLHEAEAALHDSDSSKQ